MVKIQAIRSGDAVDNDGQLLSTFLVNDQIAIDAAALGTMVSAAVQAQITAVFLSHCHMDHVATLPIFLEQRFFIAAGELTVYAHQASITALREHLFNDVLWPDLFRIQAEENLELCRFRSMTVAESVQCNGLSVSAIPMNHTVPTLGFLVEAPEGSVAFVSDTQYDHQWIQSLHDAANLRCLFVECTFVGYKISSSLARTIPFAPPLAFSLNDVIFKLHKQESAHLLPLSIDHLKNKFRQKGLPLD